MCKMLLCFTTNVNRCFGLLRYLVLGAVYTTVQLNPHTSQRYLSPSTAEELIASPIFYFRRRRNHRVFMRKNKKKHYQIFKRRRLLRQQRRLLRRKRKKRGLRRSLFRYIFRPIVLLTGQPVLFTWSIKRRRIAFTYNRFLKTFSLAGVSKTMSFCLRVKEPSYFLVPYTSMLTDLDMFSHRRLLRLAQSSLYWFVLHNFGVLLGFYFSCSGKISVGGNSRTRTMLKSYGYKSSSFVTTQTTNSSAIINTVTGCLGLLLIFFY